MQKHGHPRKPAATAHDATSDLCIFGMLRLGTLLLAGSHQTKLNKALHLTPHDLMI